VAFADFVHGVPVGAQQVWTGNFFDLVKPYALVGGLTTLSIFSLHGANYLSLKTTGEMQERARKCATLLAPIAFFITFVFLGWTYLSAHAWHQSGLVPPFLPIVTLIVLAAASWLTRDKMDGWAFIAVSLTIVGLFTTLMLNLYPDVLISSVSRADTITITQAASHPYTLKVMSIVAVIFTPFVLVYQGWTYWVFRKRVARPSEETTGAPASSH
jgi:cytochrome d ubiquinol oxidase subunit II